MAAEIVENGQTVVENCSGASIADDNVFSDISFQLAVEEFELLEILDYD
jgi:hypothetical protein